VYFKRRKNNSRNTDQIVCRVGNCETSLHSYQKAQKHKAHEVCYEDTNGCIAIELNGISLSLRAIKEVIKCKCCQTGDCKFIFIENMSTNNRYKLFRKTV
jgi:hypothetical protein